jgi:hypothetical protein
MRVSDAGIFLSATRMIAGVRRKFRNHSKTLMESMFLSFLQIRFQAHSNRKPGLETFGETRAKFCAVSVLPRSKKFSTEAPAEALCGGA